MDPNKTIHRAPLKICLLSYRSNPHSGGQGVYLKNLSGALHDLGHEVEVVSGPPDSFTCPVWIFTTLKIRFDCPVLKS
jgi:hypothetical protein